MITKRDVIFRNSYFYEKYNYTFLVESGYETVHIWAYRYIGITIPSWLNQDMRSPYIIYGYIGITIPSWLNQDMRQSIYYLWVYRYNYTFLVKSGYETVHILFMGI